MSRQMSNDEIHRRYAAALEGTGVRAVPWSEYSINPRLMCDHMSQDRLVHTYSYWGTKRNDGSAHLCGFGVTEAQMMRILGAFKEAAGFGPRVYMDYRIKLLRDGTLEYGFEFPAQGQEGSGGQDDLGGQNEGGATTTR